MTPAEFRRFWSKVLIGDGCWEWLGTKHRFGYGMIRVAPGTNPTTAHRVAYESAVGPIPEGLSIDHLCRNPPCVRPDHLEPVTLAENSRRAMIPRTRPSHCPKGHVYDEANTYVQPSGSRVCRTCSRASRARSEAKKRERAHV